MATSQDFVNWICKEGLDPRFLQLIFRAENSFLHEISSGVAHSTIYFPEAKAFHVCIPDVEEQRRILSLVDQKLSQLDSAVKSLREILREAERLRASIYKYACEGRLVEAESQLAKQEGRSYESGADLVDSTPHPTRPSRWKTRSKDQLPGHAAIGVGSASPPLPSGWTWSALVDVAEMSSGHTPSRRKPEYWDGDIPWIGIPDARERNGQAIFETAQHITKAGLDNSAAQLLPAGTVCVSRTASIGYVVTMGRPMATSQDFVNWTPTRAVTSDWLNIVFSADRNVLQSFAYGSVHSTIYFPEWLSMHIAVPPKAEQIRIAEEVERRITLADKASAVTQSCLTRSTVLKSAILGSEFPGSLKQALQEARASRVAVENLEGDLGRKQLNDDSKDHVNGGRVLSRLSAMRILSFELRQDYFSLKAAKFQFRSIAEESDTISPICLVGLNGSGKSNLIELLSEVFCGLELSLLPWDSIGKKFKLNKLDFALEYLAGFNPVGAPIVVRIDKQPLKDAKFTFTIGESDPTIVERSDQLSYLPTRVVGYSSGLNETISLPYLRTETFYSEEVRKRAIKEEKLRRAVTDYVDTRMLFSSYESNALILIANFLFHPPEDLRPYEDKLRIKSLGSFKLHFKPTYKGKNSVKLTEELKGYRNALKRSASKIEVDPKTKRETMVFHSDDESFQSLKASFKDGKQFFEAAYKLSLLNALELSTAEKNFFLKENVREGQLDRPPIVSRSNRVFDIDSIKVVLKDQVEPIDYAGLSDGEHQFIQVYGSTVLFDEPGCLFLLDEPETHFNPLWRREFVELLNEDSSTKNQELMISTHSPFVVSGCHGRNVIKFTREGNRATAAPADFETYGASYDYLLQRLFTLPNLVADLPLTELQSVIDTGDLPELKAAVSRFGESMEKQFLYEKIYELDPDEAVGE